MRYAEEGPRKAPALRWLYRGEVREWYFRNVRSRAFPLSFGGATYYI